MSQCSTSVSCLTAVFINISSITTELLGAALVELDAVRILGRAQTLADTQHLLDTVKPDISLVGSRPGREQATGLAFVEQVRAISPHTRQIILGQEMKPEDEISFLRAGAKGLLCESRVTLPVLSKCIRSVGAGQIWANSEQLERLLATLTRPGVVRIRDARGTPILSKREEEVLHLLADGMSNRDLAAALNLSEHTVKNHLFRIFDKLGVASRMEAVLYALSRREQQSMPGAVVSSAPQPSRSDRQPSLHTTGR